jgi:hypothetical protein
LFVSLYVLMHANLCICFYVFIFFSLSIFLMITVNVFLLKDWEDSPDISCFQWSLWGGGTTRRERSQYPSQGQGNKLSINAFMQSSVFIFFTVNFSVVRTYLYAYYVSMFENSMYLWNNKCIHLFVFEVCTILHIRIHVK